MNTNELEQKRFFLQKELDSKKSKKERNILGQHSTPYKLANDIFNKVKNYIDESKEIRFLDPAIGTGVFYSALKNNFDMKLIVESIGYDIDEHYGKPSSILWSETKLNYLIDDFTMIDAPYNEEEKFNFIVCNPPYVRHHHINGNKSKLKEKIYNSLKIKISSLAGLYCYFMMIAHEWMQEDGISVWLIPSEFMDVNYGNAIKEYLTINVTLLSIHRFDPSESQFDDAIVSSSVVIFKKKSPTENNKVDFSFGGELNDPNIKKEISIDILKKEKKWTRFPFVEKKHDFFGKTLGDFFTIKRGIATGDNKFFILNQNEINRLSLPIDQFRPILPSPRFLNHDVIQSDDYGYPSLNEGLFVLDCKMLIDEVKCKYPSLYEYIEYGKKENVHERFLCKSRKIWYSQENRPESMFYCTYIGRVNKSGKKAFRFIFNKSKAIVSNSYLILYPKDNLTDRMNKDPSFGSLLFDALNMITTEDMIDEGRVYGGGMHKLEPRELAKVNATVIYNLFSNK